MSLNQDSFKQIIYKLNLYYIKKIYSNEVCYQLTGTSLGPTTWPWLPAGSELTS